MVQVRKAPHPVEVRTVTKDGECHVDIKLEIVITLDSDGLKVGVVKEDKEPDEQLWAVPDFGDIPKVQFGKKA